MSMYRRFCLTAVLILASQHCVFGQSEQRLITEDSSALNNPQVAMRFKVFELNDNPATRSAFAKFTGIRKDADSTERTVSSQHVDELVQSTKQFSQFLDDLCKLSHGKVISGSEVRTSSGSPARFQRGEMMDFTKGRPELIKSIEICESADSDAAADDAARNGSSRLVGTTILATGTIGENKSVKLDAVGTYAQIDNNSAGLKSQSIAVHVVLDKDHSVVLGPWQSHREIVTREKVPGLGSLPKIGRVFQRTTTASASTVVLVSITTEIVKPQVTLGSTIP